MAISKKIRNTTLEYAEFFKEVLRIDPYILASFQQHHKVDVLEEEYFDLLYVDRVSIRKNIEEALRRYPHDLICVVGPRGSGKSTMGKKIKKDFEAQVPHVFFHWFDVRHEGGSTCLDALEDCMFFFRTWMKNKYYTFFQENGVDLLTFLLDESIDQEYRPENVFTPFCKILNRGLRREMQWAKEDLKRVLEREWAPAARKKLKEDCENFNVQIWLKYLERGVIGGERNANRQKILEIEREVASLTKVLHLAYAYNYFIAMKKEGGSNAAAEEKEKARQIFWFDNIDNLDGEAQEQLVNVLHALQREMHELVQVVIAAREEHVFTESHNFDIGAPTFRKVIFFDNPHNLAGVETNVVEEQHRVMQEEIRKIVEKRLIFLPVLFKRHYPDRDLNERAFELLKRVVWEVIVPIFEQEKMIYVANNSFRELLPMYAHFLTFLLKKYDHYLEKEKREFEEFPPVLNDPEYFQVTELLYWLSYESEYFEFYNVAEFCENPTRFTEGNGPKCFLPHLMLTCIWNMGEQQRYGSGTGTFVGLSVRTVIQELGKIGFSKDACKKVLYKLYRPEKGRSHFIVIETRAIIKTPQDIRSDFHVRITARGKVALSRIFNSFGYFYGNIKTIQESKLPYTLPANRIEDGMLLQKYLNKMAALHLNGLSVIKKSFEASFEAQNGNRLQKGIWLDMYLQKFGIPIDNTLARKQALNSSIRIGGKRYILSFPYLLESILPYFDRTSIARELESLLNQFNGAVERLREGKCSSQ